jgi:hypothetical protein
MIIPSKSARSMAAAVIAGCLFALPAVASAQETTTTTVKPKVAVAILTVDSALVVYVSGDDAVLKMPDGSLRLFELVTGTPLYIDGKQASPSDLKPGMTIAHAKLHTRMHSDVTTVTEVSGTILAKNGRNVTLRLEDGTSKIYRAPYDATFNVNGQETSYDNVTKGMKISVTAVKTQGLTSQTNRTAAVAQTPPQSGTLVIIKWLQKWTRIVRLHAMELNP